MWFTCSQRLYIILTILLGECGLPALEDFNIIWHSNLCTLIVPDEGYYRNESYAYPILTILFRNCGLLNLKDFIWHSNVLHMIVPVITETSCVYTKLHIYLKFVKKKKTILF